MNKTEQNHFWDINISSSSLRIPSLLPTLAAYFHNHNSPLFVPILNWMSLVYTGFLSDIFSLLFLSEMFTLLSFLPYLLYAYYFSSDFTSQLQ
jgi:hypothetical protein